MIDLRMYDRQDGTPAPWWAYVIAAYAVLFWGGFIGVMLAWFIGIWM